MFSTQLCLSESVRAAETGSELYVESSGVVREHTREEETLGLS